MLFRSKSRENNIELRDFAEKAKIMSPKELHALIVEYRLKSAAVCLPGDALVAVAAVAETLPVLNMAGTLIGKATNPDYKNSYLRLRIDYFLGSIMGGAFAKGMNSIGKFIDPREDDYMTYYAYAGTITSKEALLGSASTCAVLLKKAEIAKSYYRGDNTDPRVMAIHNFDLKVAKAAQISEAASVAPSASAQ